jgi:Zn-dependent peptidase ImmA (M78 family)/DNA-binding XRE family transcriptional regulator
MVPAMDEAEVGAQIRQLRERIGLQSQELAARVGIDASAMSNIERGKRSVKTLELLAIAQALNVSPMAILEPDSLLAKLPMAARVQAPGLAESKALGRLTALTELHQVLEDQGIPARPHLDDVPAVDEPRWKESADALAIWATERLGELPIGDDRFAALSDAIEERFGIDILVEEHGDDALAGAALTDRRFPLIYVNANQPTARALFTLAHELAHVLSGRGDVTIDPDLTARNDRERFANAFAAVFLMPERVITAEIKLNQRTAKTLANLVDQFGVSFESLIYRLHNLRLINALGRDRLQAYGWRGVLAETDEDKQISLIRRLSTRPEQRPPELLTGRAFAGYERGMVSVRPLAGLLHVDQDELLERMTVMQRDAKEVVDEDYSDVSENVTDEEAFSGSPV